MKPLFKLSMLSLLISAQAFAKEHTLKLIKPNGEPLAQTQVKIESLNLSAITNNNGEVIIDVEPGDYVLDIHAEPQGHIHQTISVSSDNQVLEVTADFSSEKKIVILANPLEHTKLDMAAPAILLSGEQLTLKRSGTVGEILSQQPGMSMSSFGPSVARPVVRGLSAGRIMMTTNQMIVQDASTTSADHDVALEPLLAEQIEVLKGPATLLYGSGAIGGVVNVTDNRINPNYSPGLEGGIEIRLGDSTTTERSTVFALDYGNDKNNFHFDGFKSSTDDLLIPGYGESDILLAFEGESSEDLEEESGILENSGSDAKGVTLGWTRLTDWGHIGFAVQNNTKTYGVPGHGEHHEEDPAPIEEEEHHGVEIDMEQTRYDVQVEINAPFANIEQWFVAASYTDYQHQELEEDEIGTEFLNKATEVKTYVKHAPIAEWKGIVGYQWSDRDFSAIGDEAFVPPSITETHALFLLEEKKWTHFKVETGVRFESVSVVANGFAEQSFGLTSGSLGTVIDLSANTKMAANISLAERAPSVEELFSYGEHAATQTFEVGNSNLDKESALNFDLSFRFNFDDWSAEINVFQNDFSDYIYGQPGGEMDELPLISYQQQDASFYGLETSFNAHLFSLNGVNFDFGLVADFVHAEFTTGEYIPRMPPKKYGFNLNMDADLFSAELSFIRHGKQQKLFESELPTNGFDMLDLEIAYRFIG